MSSDHFLHFQKILRDVKEVHNVDLTSPNGVTIGDRKYPAISKAVWMHMYEPEHNMIDYDADFNIPFENGTQLHVSAGNGHFATMSSQLHVPTIHLHGDGTKTYSHGSALHIGVDSFHNSHTAVTWGSASEPGVDIHDIINKYSKLPHQGTYDFDYSKEGSDAFLKVRPNATTGLFGVDGEHLALNPEELQEHNNNLRFNPVHNPLHIRVGLAGARGVNMHHLYNTQTEQMQQFDWR